METGGLQVYGEGGDRREEREINSWETTTLFKRERGEREGGDGCFQGQ